MRRFFSASAIATKTLWQSATVSAHGDFPCEENLFTRWGISSLLPKHLILLLLLVLTACATQSFVPIVSRSAKVQRFPGDGMSDEYVRYVEQGREYLRLGRFDLAEGYFEVASHEQFFEMSNYGVWIELAEVHCRNGNTVEGLAVLADYDMALDVDIGKESCVDEWHPKYDSPPNPRMSMRVFGELCGALIPHLSSVILSDEDRRKNQAMYLDMKAESAVLARSCEDISSVR